MHVSVSLQTHHELDHTDPVRPPIDEVADEPDPRIGACPLELLIEETGLAEQGDEPLDVPVHVPDHEGGHLRWSRARAPWRRRASAGSSSG